MAHFETAYIGAAPAEEDCAQLGRTPNFDKYNRLEVYIYHAAIIARWGSPPEGVQLQPERCGHDFGSHLELQARYDPDDESACAYVGAIANGLARWRDIGFLPPVTYGANSAVKNTNYASRNEAIQRTIVTLERQRVEGFGCPAEAMFLANLRTAYPKAAERADTMLRQISTERAIRLPANRKVQLYYPYTLTFFPELFNQHRGSDYPDGDVIDVTAHELRLARRTYIMCDIGSVKTIDDALALCWEHMARYVIH